MLQTAATEEYISENIRKISKSETLSDKFIVPDWHKKIVLDRISKPKTPVDAFEMIDELELESIAKI